jgi:hypothetical protein
MKYFLYQFQFFLINKEFLIFYIKSFYYVLLKFKKKKIN